MTRDSFNNDKYGFSQALPRSLEKMIGPNRAVYIKVSWLKGNFSAGLPIAPKRRQWPYVAAASSEWLKLHGLPA